MKVLKKRSEYDTITIARQANVSDEKHSRRKEVKMVKHIILWKLKEEHNNEDVKRGIKEGLEGLLGVIPGLIEIKVQTEKLASSNADVMLYSIFESEDSLRGYAVHPDHVKVADTKVRPFNETRSCIDFCEE